MSGAKETWIRLRKISRARGEAVVVILVEAPPQWSAWVGLVAGLPADEGPFGDLTKAAFWPDHHTRLAGRAFGGQPALVYLEPGFRYYLSPLRSPRRALILGAGHVGRALAELLVFLEYDCTLFDDRPEFLEQVTPSVTSLNGAFEYLAPDLSRGHYAAVVIVTRGHYLDGQALRGVLDWPVLPEYLGMIGSRRRTREMLRRLAEEGFPVARLSRIHTPIGLPIGAQTPAEIAVSVAAEIINVFNGGAIKRLR